MGSRRDGCEPGLGWVGGIRSGLPAASCLLLDHPSAVATNFLSRRHSDPCQMRGRSMSANACSSWRLAGAGVQPCTWVQCVSRCANCGISARCGGHNRSAMLSASAFCRVPPAPVLSQPGGVRNAVPQQCRRSGCVYAASEMAHLPFAVALPIPMQPLGDA